VRERSPALLAPGIKDVLDRGEIGAGALGRIDSPQTLGVRRVAPGTDPGLDLDLDRVGIGLVAQHMRHASRGISNDPVATTAGVRTGRIDIADTEMTPFHVYQLRLDPSIINDQRFGTVNGGDRLISRRCLAYLRIGRARSQKVRGTR